MPTIVANELELLSLLGAEVAAHVRLIAIDGVSGSGKSTLGAQLEAAYDGSKHIDFDKHLNKRQAKFVDALHVEEMKAQLSAPFRPIIATGVCALRVLEACGLCPDLLIYVKRMRPYGWVDEDETGERPAGDESPEQVEVRNYHRAYRPHERAAFVLERMV